MKKWKTLTAQILGRWYTKVNERPEKGASQSSPNTNVRWYTKVKEKTWKGASQSKTSKHQNIKKYKNIKNKT